MNERILKYLDFEISNVREAIRQPGWTKWVLLSAITGLLYISLEKTFQQSLQPIPWKPFVLFYILKVVSENINAFKTAIVGRVTSKVRTVELSLKKSSMAEGLMLDSCIEILFICVVFFEIHEYKSLYYLCSVLNVLGVALIWWLVAGRGLILPVSDKIMGRSNWGWPFSLLNIFIVIVMYFLQDTPTKNEFIAGIALCMAYLLFIKYLELTRGDDVLLALIDLRREASFNNEINESDTLGKIANILWGIDHDQLIAEMYRDQLSKLDECERKINSIELNLSQEKSDDDINSMKSEFKQINSILSSLEKFDIKSNLSGLIIWVYVEKLKIEEAKTKYENKLNSVKSSANRVQVSIE